MGLLEDARAARLGPAEDVDAAGLVNNRFDIISTMMNEYESKWNSSMDTLKSVFSGVTAADISKTLNYDYITDGDYSLAAGEPPSKPSTNINSIDKPTKFDDLQKYVFQNIVKFDETLDEVKTPDINFMEAVYQSGLLDDFKAVISNLITNGGTGLGENIEAAIWDRAQARLDTENEKTNDEALNYFASRGHTLPTGALVARLRQLASEQTRANIQLTSEIAIEQARLAQGDTQNVRAIAIQLSQLDRVAFNQVQQRAYEKARDVAGVFLQAYNTKIARFAAIAEGIKTNVQTQAVQADAISKYDNAIAQVYKADVDSYAAQVQSELGVIEVTGKLYASEIAGWSAKADSLSKELNAKVDVLRARMQQSNNQTALSIQEAELVLSKYLKGLELDEDVQKTHSSLMTQIMASLFTAVSVSASMSNGQSYSDTFNQNITDGTAIIHKNYNYSVSE